MSRKQKRNKLIGDIKEWIAKQSTLRLSESKRQLIIEGKLLIESEKFEISVVLDNSFPRSFPVIYETGGRIPRKPWNHMYEDGRCCLCTEMEQRRFFPVDAHISEYFTKLVIPFFENRLHYEITGKYIKERRHGVQGIYDSYKDAFKTEDPKFVLKMMKALASGNLKGHHPCECESGKKRRNCHGPLLWEVSSYVSPKQAQTDIKLATAIRNK